MIIGWCLIVSILAGFIIYTGANKNTCKKLSVYCRNYVPITFTAVILISIVQAAFLKPGSQIGPEMMRIFSILSVTALSVMIISNFYLKLVATPTEDSFSTMDSLSELTATSDWTINVLGLKVNGRFLLKSGQAFNQVSIFHYVLQVYIF